MKYTDNWDSDWHVMVGDENLFRRLISVIDAYLTALKKKGVAKLTLDRHPSGYHALG